MSGPLFFGLFDWWAAHIINLIHGGSGPEPGGPGIFGVLEWTAVFVGILIAFFWEGIGEGIGGAIVALVALAMQADVIVNAGGDSIRSSRCSCSRAWPLSSVGGAHATSRCPQTLLRHYQHPRLSVASGFIFGI